MDDEQIYMRGGTDRDIEAYAEANGADLKQQMAPWHDPTIRWVCEEHPDHDQGHRIFTWRGYKECGGAGMPKERCYFTDHSPVWDGNEYICIDCYIPFGIITPKDGAKPRKVL
jgi:hypothetical protein